MMMTILPYAGLLARWLLATLSLTVGIAFAQDAATQCGDDDFVEGVIWDLGDDGEGRAFALGSGAVFVSCDDGATWTRQPSPNAFGYTMLVHPDDSAVLFVGSFETGVYRSTDHGESFSAISVGTIDEGVGALAARADGSILAGTPSGIYASDAGATSWSLLTDVTAGALVRTILIDPQNSNFIYAGTNGKGAFRSMDGGLSWDSIGPFTQVNVLEFYPGDTSAMVAAAWDGIWHSTDAGTTWINVGGIRNSDFRFDPVDPIDPMIAYRTSRSSGMLKSSDRGLNWTQINNGLTEVMNDMYAVHVLPGGTLLVGTELGGVYRSTDGGASWSSTGDESNSDTGSDSGSGGTGGNSGGGSTDTNVAKVANLTIDIKFRGDNGNVDAGKNAKFKITITNNGPNTSTGTTFSINWSHDVFLSSPHHLPYSMSASQGACHPSYSEPDCSLADIPAGASVEIEFSGSTEKNERHTFNLDAWADNSETGGSAFATKAIKSKVDTTTTCVLIFCSTTKDSGGGAAGIWMLLLLGVAVVRRRLVQPRSY
jgi:uncharacterized protein (TIGR03382 family)